MYSSMHCNFKFCQVAIQSSRQKSKISTIVPYCTYLTLCIKLIRQIFYFPLSKEWFPFPMSSDILFSTLEKFHVGRQWGRFLDAGTGR
jgi:hypothetical protein